MGALKRDLIVNIIAASKLAKPSWRYRIYKRFGIDTHTQSISPGCFFGGSNVHIGSGTFINYGCFFDNIERIDIGNDCAIAMEVMFCTSNHKYSNPKKRAGDVYGKPIKVGNGAWIGTRAIIMPGVTVGDGCIIAAGAVVTKDCDSHSVYAGVPAKKIKSLE